MKLGVCIYTYDKIKEACIQMEIIRELWWKYFSEIKIVHTYNWRKKDHEKKYLEDEIIYMENPWHYKWAADMIDKWVERLLKYDLDYIIVNACDTRRIKPEIIEKIIKWMKDSWKVIWTCPRSFKWENQNNWRWVWLATDTFILDVKREREYKIFPLRWNEFHDKYIDFIRYLWRNNVSVEGLLASRFISACSRIKMYSNSELWPIADNLIYFLNERIPTLISTTERNFDTPELWLFTNHNLWIKKEILKTNNLILWKYTKEFIS